MAQVITCGYVTRAVCLILTVTSVCVYSQTENNLAHTQSQSYFAELSKVSRLAQQKQIIDSINIQEELDKLSETFFSLSALYRKQIQKKPPTSLLYSDDASDVVNLQDLLISAMGNVAADEATTSTCANDTGFFITGIFERHLWAIQFLDSFGKPGPGLTTGRFNFVGDYSLCRSASNFSADGKRKIRGNYCTLKASLGPASTLGLLNLQLGACLPDSCTAAENTLFMGEVIQRLGLNGTLQVQSAECHTEEREMTTATVVSIVVLVIIGVMMILGTSFDIVFIQHPKWRASSTKEDKFLTNDLMSQIPSYSAIGEHNGGPDAETTTLLGKARQGKHADGDLGTCAKIFVAFSVYTNGSKVLNTRQPPGSLSAIHGIRFLSMSWVLLGHIYVFCLTFVGNLATAFPTLLNRWTFDAVANALVCVDTFFTLSGLLTAYLTLTEIKKRGWKINWPLYYFHRFWRLTPPYMLAILIILGLQQYMGSGALWSSVQPADKTNCESFWWTNLLYINNLVNIDKMCFGHSWYLANDMQFFILSPLMIVPFFFNVSIGVAVCVGFLLISWITTGVLSTENQWPSTLISNAGGRGMELDISAWFQDYYIKPWCRIGPYVIGVLAGCLLALNNGKIKMRWYAAGLGWIIAVTTGLAVVYGLHGDITGESVSSLGVSAFYNAVARSAWGACVCWVIIACVSGYGGFVDTLLSWSPFVMLGRLTYMAYLIHPCLMYVYFQNQEQLFYITDTNVVVVFCGIVVLTNMTAFVLMLAFESPWIGLEKTFIRKKQKD